MGLNEIIKFIRNLKCAHGFHKKFIESPRWFHEDNLGFDWCCKWCWKEGEIRYEADAT